MVGTNLEKRTFRVTNIVIQNVLFSGRGDVAKRLIFYSAPQVSVPHVPLQGHVDTLET